LLGRGESEELADLKGTGTERAIVVRSSRVSEKPLDLTYGGLQEKIVGGTWRKNVGVLGVILRDNDEPCRKMPSGI
jgi:hypothetical protein